MTNAQLARMPKWYREYAEEATELQLAPAVTWRMATDKGGRAIFDSTAKTVRTLGVPATQRMLKVWTRLAKLGYIAVEERLT